MIELSEPGTRQVGARSPALLVLCSVAGLGALAAAYLNRLGELWFVGIAEDDAAVYVSLAVLVAALLAWHLWPRRSWSVLLVAGAVCAVPTPVFWLAEDVFADWMLTPYLVLTAVAPPLLLVGVLGVATASWRAGRRGAAAAVLGAALVVPALTGFSVAGRVFGLGSFVPVIELVVLAATVVLAIAAVLTGPAPAEPEPRPEWQVTIGGALAGVAPAIISRLWSRPSAYRPNGDADVDAYYAEAGQHFLLVGLVVLGIGLLAGAAAGLRVLVTAVAAGLVLGALSGLAWPAARQLQNDLPDGIPAVLAIGALAVAVVVAVPRVRVVVGVAGLGVLIAGLLLLWWAISENVDFFAVEAASVLVPVLLVVAVVAAVSTLAALGTGVVAPGAAPGTFAGVTAAVTSGVGGINTYFDFTSAGQTQPAGDYLPVIVPLAIAIVLTVIAHRLWHNPPGAISNQDYL